MALSDKLSNLASILLFGYCLFAVFVQHKEAEQNYYHKETETQELVNVTQVLNKTGQLTAAGWSRRGPEPFNASQVYPVWFGLGFLRDLRLKKWDYFSFNFGAKFVQIAVADVFFAGVSFVSVFDFETNEYVKFKVKLIPLIDKAMLPKFSGDLAGCPPTAYTVSKGAYSLNMTQTYDNVTHTCAYRVQAAIDGRFTADLTSLRNTTEENLYEMLPVSENHKYFFYSLKALNSRCHGRFTLDGKTSEAVADACGSIMDQSRAVMTYKTNWIWASASGLTTDGKRLSLNFGTGVAHAKSVNVFYAFKLEGRMVSPRPGPITLDRDNLMAGVTFRTAAFFPSNSQWMSVTFTPVREHVVSENLVITQSNLVYLYGTFSGRFVDEEGRETSFTGLRGVVEVAKMKW